MRKREGQHELHAHTARKFFHVLLGRKLKTLAQRTEALRVPISIGKTAERCHVLDLQGFREGARIKNNANALLDAPFQKHAFSDRATEHFTFTLIRLQDAEQHLDRGGLSRSVRAHNGASLDGKPDIFKMEAIVALP